MPQIIVHLDPEYNEKLAKVEPTHMSKSDKILDILKEGIDKRLEQQSEVDESE